jgi:hypothetical protein
MNRLRMLLAILLVALPLLAEEPKKTTDDFNENKAFRNKVFELQSRNPNDVAAAIKLLGSGFKGAGISVNSQLRTITVRDFPENIAAIEEAIKRLDRAEVTPNVTLNVAVLIGSKTALPNAPPVPDELAPVVRQLQSTLRYSTYGLLTAAIHRTKPGLGVENSGVAESALIGMTAKEGRPIFYSYAFRQITFGEKTLNVDRFSFDMRIPIDLGGSGNIQYQNVGFNTPVSIRQNEKVVIGTTTMGDKALVVVVTANVEPAP